MCACLCNRAVREEVFGGFQHFHFGSLIEHSEVLIHDYNVRYPIWHAIFGSQTDH